MPSPEPMLLGTFEAPIGEMLIVFDRIATVLAIDWRDHMARMVRLLRRRHGPDFDWRDLSPCPLPATIGEPLRSYFAGSLTAIDLVPVDPGGSAFRQGVWRALRLIPPGQVMSYGALARRTGNPAAVRAVGAANGANPIGVVVPCHRLVGTDGALTGYGGGLARKRWLLEHEGVALTGDRVGLHQTPPPGL